MGILCRLLAVVLAATVSVPAAGQQWPARSLRIVTGTPPGGSPDFVSRLLADKLSERLGQTVLVEHSATTGSPPGMPSPNRSRTATCSLC